MAGTLRIEEIDRLVLAWLVVPRKKPSYKSLATMLTPFVRGTGAAPDSVGRQSLARLKTRGDIEADTTWMLSPAGQKAALAALGIPSLPKRASWKWVHSLLVARGHGVEPTPQALKSVADSERLAASVLQKHHGIQLRGRSEPTTTVVGSALAWRELGVESTEPFTLKAVLVHLAHKATGTTPRDSRAALSLLAAAALGVRAGDAPLRVALVQKWMEAGAPPSNGAQAPERPPIATPPVPAVVGMGNDEASLRDFSQRALAAARASQSGRWGEHKVFVSHAWDEFQRRDGGAAVGLDAFKDMLVRANRAGHLSLSSADLVEAMNADDVRRSEIESLGATFHFVRVD